MMTPLAGEEWNIVLSRAAQLTEWTCLAHKHTNTPPLNSSSSPQFGVLIIGAKNKHIAILAPMYVNSKGKTEMQEDLDRSLLVSFHHDSAGKGGGYLFLCLRLIWHDITLGHKTLFPRIRRRRRFVSIVVSGEGHARFRGEIFFPLPLPSSPRPSQFV